MDAKFKISPRILDHLGVAAYTSLQKCLAELCSNCYDADASIVWIDLPKEFNANSRIVIKDDGIGMSPDDIREKYLFIGYNRRSTGEKTAIKRRPIIGNKGIGKLAGFGVANSVEVISIKDNVKSQLILNKEMFDNFGTLTDCYLTIEVQVTDKPSGTELILKNLSSQTKPIDPNTLRRHLFSVLPNVADFKVYVNGIHCTAEDVPGKKYPINEQIADIGTVKGFYLIANVRQRQPGVVIKVRERAVTEPSLFGLEKRSHFSFSAEKILGEIDADFLDPYINTSRDNFLSEVEEVQTLNDHLHNYFKNVIDEMEKDAEGKRTKQLIEVSTVQERLAKLPPHIRNKARRVIEGVISRLKEATDEEVNELVEWILRYFESNVLRELMNSIIEADNEDIAKLSDLINDWGLRQINSVTEIINDQIKIIKKLEELTDSDKTYEIEIHKLIEGNLWLVREGLELWASDKPLKYILDKELDKRFKDNEDERPDIVCRSRDGGYQAVILEFKRPKVKVRMDHVTQALEYKGIIETHRPNIVFETFVIGRDYDHSVLTVKDNLAKGGLYLWSLNEILQRTRARFETILEILNK